MITKDDVSYIAHLSRIHLKDDQEIEHLRKTLGNILSYIEKLKDLDVKNIEPTSHVLPLKNVFREDHIRDSLKKEDLARMTQRIENGYFKVPKVIE